MPRTRIRETNIEDISFLAESEFNNFFQAVVITGTSTDTAVTQSFADFFPGQGLIEGAGSVTVITGSNFVTISGGAGGGSAIDDINNISSGSITITGTGGVATITEGNVITVSGIEEFINPLAGFSQAILKIDAPQTTSNNTTLVIAWDSVVSDTDGWADLGTDNEVLTVPGGLGITHVRVMAQVSWASNATGRRLHVLRKNGVQLELANVVIRTAGAGASAANSILSYQTMSPIVAASPGDTFGVEVFQNSGGNLDITDTTGDASTWFTVEQVNPIATSGIEFTAISGSFTESLTVSGVPVATGTLVGPVIGASPGGTSLVIPTSSETKVEFDTLEIDTHGGFDTTLFRYIPPVAGIYHMTATIRFSSDLGSGTTHRISIFKNGSVVRRSAIVGYSITSGGVTITSIEEANGTTDFFEIFVLQQGGSDATILGGFADTYFLAHLLK